MHDDEETDELKKKIERSVIDNMADFEKNRIPRALKGLTDMQKIAPEYAKTCRILMDALKKEGFDHADAMEIVRDYVKARGSVAY